LNANYWLFLKNIYIRVFRAGKNSRTIEKIKEQSRRRDEKNVRAKTARRECVVARNGKVKRPATNASRREAEACTIKV